VNSRDAMPAGGRLRIETSNVHVHTDNAAKFAGLGAGDYVRIDVGDTGAGMPPEVVERAFDPFFTTKPIGEGTGLGLSQVYGFVKQSGGHVKLQSDPGKGTTVSIFLPRLLQVTATAESEALSQAPTGRAEETILVVEDDTDVRSYTVDSLRDLGFTVLQAHDGLSALRTLDQHPEIQLLFTDVGLPGMNGRELVDEALQRRARLKVLFTSGYARSAIVHDGRLDPGVELLTKPFTRSQLAARVREVLDTSGGTEDNRKDKPKKVALIVEDEPLVRMLLADTLLEFGFEVLQAGSAAEALAIIGKRPQIAAAFIDIGLPDRSGLELAAEIRDGDPAIGIIICSGYGDQPDDRLKDDSQVVFIGKPYDQDTLHTALRAIDVDLPGI